MTYQSAKAFRDNLRAERDRLAAEGVVSHNDYLLCVSALRIVEDRIKRDFPKQAKADRIAPRMRLAFGERVAA